MPAKIIDGRKISAEIGEELRHIVEAMAKKNIVPGLAMILVGEDPASLTYIGNKTRLCAKLGIYSETIRLSTGVSLSRILKIVKGLNERSDIHGILVQLPLPAHLKADLVLEAILPIKDVDGLHPINSGRMMVGDPMFLPCTPAGIQQLLVRTGNDPGGKHVVILGRSATVGKPLANLLLAKGKGANATVTVCHTGTRDVSVHSCSADILVVAIGRPQAITGKMIKEGAVVIDVGIHRQPDAQTPRGYTLVGDVDFSSAREVASWITPVPGGVGPMTVVMLMVNTVRAAQLQREGGSQSNTVRSEQHP
ncbi:bifunctional 5,10-methylenetetrahydrofolate dehydrogenase/5,10-methenyltetrahydrofolate cyclohydrolase [bacterium]|nr:bifunctional 5,10-methylenetetrahydrofolate dehydrogenase/5,10-methenyltetrahydrofolate cyclohydrolase [bacterium]